MFRTSTFGKDEGGKNSTMAINTLEGFSHVKGFMTDCLTAVVIRGYDLCKSNNKIPPRLEMLCFVNTCCITRALYRH